jgi:hypothetical protein
MRLSVLLCVSAAFLMAGCGGATGSGATGSTTLAFSDAAVSFARSTPVPAAEAASASECAETAECQRACETGEVQSCTRWGDLLHVSEPDRAEALWLDACQRRDGMACLRMMALAASEPRTADAYARHGCAYGEVSACEMLGVILMLRGAAAEEEQRAAFLHDAAEVFEMSCGFEHWRSCLWAGDLYAENALADEQSRRALLERTGELVTNACTASDASACLFRGEVLEQAGALEDARASYTRSCRLFLESTVNISYADALQEPPCRRATELGVAPPPESIEHKAPPGLRHASRAAVEARRISGSPTLYPPETIQIAMQRRGVSTIAASLGLCVSASGLVQGLHFKGATGFPTYDLELVETLRTWRYRPYLLDGRPVTVCTTVTFVYTQI